MLTASHPVLCVKSLLNMCHVNCVTSCLMLSVSCYFLCVMLSASLHVKSCHVFYVSCYLSVSRHVARVIRMRVVCPPGSRAQGRISPGQQGGNILTNSQTGVEGHEIKETIWDVKKYWFGHYPMDNDKWFTVPLLLLNYPCSPILPLHLHTTCVPLIAARHK